MKRALSKSQANELLRAASTLAPAAREGFFAAVDARLVGIRRPLTDDDISGAIVATLANNQTVTTSCFLCDSAPTKEASMAATNYDDDDENPFDKNGILKDGRTARVSLQMRDAALTRDAILEGRRRKQQAYDQMVAETCDAWRNPSPLPAATDAAPPHRDAAPVPRIIRDADEARQVKRAAYDEMVRESQDAWRKL